MGIQLSRLSVAEIRDRYLRLDTAVAPRILNQMKTDPRDGVRRIYRTLAARRDKEKQERLRLDAMLNFERILWKSGIQHVAGVDEVGVGPLAGPVVAAAVVFSPDVDIPGVDDSKKLPRECRERLSGIIREQAVAVSVGQAEVEEIDRLNIYHAALLAMKRAVEGLKVRPAHVLCDARRIPDLEIPQNSFNKGDGIDFSIAAASIVAKVHRDRLMEELDSIYPGYGFGSHKGYGTGEHQRAIREKGPCAVHRKSFRVIQELCGEYSAQFYAMKRAFEEAASARALKRRELEFNARRDEFEPEERHKLRLLLRRRWRLF